MAETNRFEITIAQSELLNELTAAQSVAERKTTIPILASFLLEASANDLGGGQLKITATDLDLSFQTNCTAVVKQSGSCTIPARRLHDFVKLLPGGEITIKQLDTGWIQIKAGRPNTKMVGMPRENFPQVPVFPAAGAVKLSVAALRNMIAKTIFAISNEESRYTINGLYWS